MIEIASFTPAFQAGVIDVILPIQRDEYCFAVTVEDQPDLLEIPAFYQSGAGGFWVALDGSEVVGTRFVAAHRFYEKNGFARIEESALPAAFPRMAGDTRFNRRPL